MDLLIMNNEKQLLIHFNLLVAILAAGLLSSCGKQADAPLPVPPPVAVNATNQPPPAATPNPAFEKLKGRWLRPDGGYIVEIRSVEPGGKLDAAYFNPKPIHVAKAEASQEDGTVKVFIELRDVNYPGSNLHTGVRPAKRSTQGDLLPSPPATEFRGLFRKA